MSQTKCTQRNMWDNYGQWKLLWMKETDNREAGTKSMYFFLNNNNNKPSQQSPLWQRGNDKTGAERCIGASYSIR